MTPNRARIVAVGIGMPVLIALAGGALVLSWAPDLPDAIAVHWSAAGPDRFGPLWEVVALIVGAPVLYSVFAAVASRRLQASRRPSGNQKLLLATGSFLAGVFAIGIGGTVWAQRGLADAGQADDAGSWVLLGLAGGLVLAAIAWLLLPKADNTGEQGEEIEPIAIAPSERAVWSRAVSIAPGVRALIGGAMALGLAAVIVTWIAAPQGVAFAVVALASILLLALATTVWRVTADPRGLTVRSALGWPRAHIAAAEIASVRVIHVNPTADFGGWGWRWAPGSRTGVVMRAGEAIEVTRRDGSRFAVTVDGAATGAGVLAGVVARRNAGAGRNATP